MGGFERGGEQIFYVRDNGIGFETEYTTQLLQPLGRLHDPETFPGTGFGLAIVDRIVHRLGGRVWAEGARGQGATFCFTLPGYPAGSLEPR